jgi:hypothetical protein
MVVATWYNLLASSALPSLQCSAAQVMQAHDCLLPACLPGQALCRDQLQGSNSGEIPFSTVTKAPESLPDTSPKPQSPDIEGCQPHVPPWVQQLTSPACPWCGQYPQPASTYQDTAMGCRACRARGSCFLAYKTCPLPMSRSVLPCHFVLP